MKDVQSQARDEAKALLLELATGKLTMSALLQRGELPYWERDYLTRVLPRLKKRARESNAALSRSRELRFGAEKLYLLRSEAIQMNPGRWFRDQRGFSGNRRQLELLLKSLGAPSDNNEWNAWRARSRKVRPDLRGANLSGLSLTYLNLRRARLDGAHLGAASLRGIEARNASFVGASLVEADLSYADLREVDLRKAQLRGAIFADADLTGVNLRDAVLTSCVLNRATLDGADLRGALIWGTSVWDTKGHSTAKQQGLLIAWDDPIEPLSKPAAPEDTLVVDDIRVAHFMSLLRDDGHDSLPEVFNAASSKMVLLLGRFTDQQEEVRAALEDVLLRFGYAPVVFNFREPKDRDLIETVATLAGLASFIIADLSQPRSTPLESLLTIPQIAIPWVPIIRSEEQPFSMFAALQRKYDWVLPVVHYRSISGLKRQLGTRIIPEARARAERLRARKHPRKRSA